MKQIWREKKGLLITFIVMVVLVLIYFIGFLYYQNHFLNRTTINGVDCSNLIPDEATQKIKTDVNTYVLTIQKRNNETEKINGANIGLELQLKTDMSQVLEEQSAILWFINYFKNNDIKVEENWSYEEDLLLKEYDKLKCFDESVVTKPENVSVSEYQPGKGYMIKEAVQGNLVKKDEFFKEVKKAIENLEESISIEETDCYEKPEEVDATDAMKAAVETANRYVNAKLTYRFGTIAEILDGETISKWILINDSNEVSLDETKIKEFISGLYRKYTTFGMKRTFQTSYNKTIEIKGGDYGWWINRTALRNQIVGAIQAGEQAEKEVPYIQTADCYGETDYGNTYVEINLTAQHMFFYVNGTKIVESDFVSGCVADGNATPTGTYGIQCRQKDATLVGQDYDSDVSFWMPFNGNIGMHDATWRNKFGGTIYKQKGSHGCINLPYDVAEIVFQNIKKGVPVFCYELEGTESNHITTVKNNKKTVQETTTESGQQINEQEAIESNE